MSWKKYLPEPTAIPAMLILGAVGAIVVSKAFPKVAAWLSANVPTVQK